MMKLLSWLLSGVAAFIFALSGWLLADFAIRQIRHAASFEGRVEERFQTLKREAMNRKIEEEAQRRLLELDGKKDE